MSGLGVLLSVNNSWAPIKIGLKKTFNKKDKNQIIKIMFPSNYKSKLPNCKNNNYYHNCFAEHIDEKQVKYIGEWKNNKAHGKGKLFFPGNEKYYGWHKNNKKHGIGINLYEKGGIYFGQWIENKREGFGFIYWGGVKYTGFFKNDRPNGWGIMQRNNKIVEAEWAWDKDPDNKNAKLVDIESLNAYEYSIFNKLVAIERSSNLIVAKSNNLYKGLFNNEDICDKASTSEGTWENHPDLLEFVKEAKVRELDCGVKNDNKTVVVSKPKNTKPSISSEELEKEIAKRKELEKKITELEKKNKELSKPKKKEKPKPTTNSGSGFFISKLGHIITNEHVVNKCSKITVGDNVDRQVPAKLMEVDKKNDLALLRTTTLELASTDTKSLIKKLSTKNLRMEILPLATAGLMRSNDVELGEDIVVAGFPYGDIFSKDIKVTFGNVNSTKGVGDNSSQFQIQAPVQTGNSGGPIYDKYGNIVGVVVAQLDKLKMAKTIGSLPENVNFGIKASTVKQFLNSSGLPTKWAERDKPMSNKEISKIASKQTVMVVCHN